nr:uncharacterized protein LOC117605076 [Osmia lignaria]
MQNKSKEERPPIPNTWGSENALPTQSYELMDEDVRTFMIHEVKINHQSPSSNSSKDLSPMEEYLQMTKRLIESNSLSPHNTTILKQLYARYKSMKNHGQATWDPSSDSETSVNVKPFSQDNEKKIGHSFETDKSLMQKLAYPKKDATAECKVSYRGGEEKPSTSKEQGQLETLPINSMSSDKLNERKKGKISMEEVELRWIALQTVDDANFEATCDPERFEIDNTFSDFSLDNVDHEKMLKRCISQWILKNKVQLVPGNSGSNSYAKDPRNTKTKDSNEILEKEPKKEGRLNKMLKNIRIAK